ncbi:replicative DNA helicase [Herpetosiphon geysericola]|uniref:Replicative DNA helicase n=1 Tax=Herpetosiphon geysericola TaxID=70996 RepID=A0A0P6YDC6_9CHLR|nr:replicative DNA helicase [Herpetosiphon geysericola]KPL90009.1 DNA helicase [Herpetosiphon geysericola]
MTTQNYDEYAEQFTLGAILLDPDVTVLVNNILVDADDFYFEKHAMIYRAIRAVFDRRVRPNAATVYTELQRQGNHESVGGFSYLSHLTMVPPTATEVESYAVSVADMAWTRRALKNSAELARIANDNELTREAKYLAMTDKLEALGRSASQQAFTSMATMTELIYTQLEHQMEGDRKVSGVPSGYHDLDNLTGGFQNSDFIILAARPATGKTSLALNIAYNSAKESEATVAVFSLEMSREQLMQRMLATETGIDMQKVRLGEINDRDLQLLTEALGRMSTLPIYINDTPACTVAHIRSRCMQLQAEQGLDLVIIDYLQLMQGGATGRRGENRQQEVSDISRGLKALARDLNVPVIALSQLSRAVESRSSNVPMLSDLRESGSLEQDADIVMFIYREELYNPDTDKKGIAEVHISKHRNGPTGIVPLRFFRSTTRFANLDTYREAEGY